ncbi:peptide chain release factor H [Agarivorans sp. B2Z047]|uniref:peptide chain release factor H n=1 Tax=Agarivorans sp. B2Z047 TaxID=2652721 RepID=UPI00128C4EE3|nr:peptide chain release factor H [Agarivorans sp. B2Z047]MPW31764.1 peptide chain release factor H [Agarivorans sp. B2Z047]UQN44826.1 peptide chain release factor H [Agarivorans sp. B2Z047]
MILLQFSAGQGPIECCRAVALALKVIENQCNKRLIDMELIEANEAEVSGCLKSALLKLDATNSKDASQLATEWQGALLWVCQSQFRPQHKRRNWYFSGRCFEVDDLKYDAELRFQTCRASGAGGQHVNTTDSAVRATHVNSGLSVRVESERSQHANKRLARALLLQKLELTKLDKMGQQEKSRWLQHLQVERGNPVKTFKGERFKLVNS